MSVLKNLKPETIVALAAFTLAGLAPLAVSAAPQIRTKGGHGAGNGGDRLELTSSDGDGDVEISVPDDMGSSGTLEVMGVPGAGQQDELALQYCESDAQGKPIKFGCSRQTSFIHLNTPTTLMAGTYLLTYSQTVALVQVRANEKTVATLKKLKVAKVNRSVSFTVFRDFTDESMQDQLLLIKWSADYIKNYVNTYCSPVTHRYEQLCEGWNASDYHHVRDRNVKFFPDGSYSQSTSITDSGTIFQKEPRTYITDPEAGEFVSVFPGVYGVEFTDKQSGKTETRFGIRIN